MKPERQAQRRIDFALICFKKDQFGPWLDKHYTEAFPDGTTFEFVNFIESLSKVIFENLLLGGFLKPGCDGPCLASVSGLVASWYRRTKMDAMWSLSARIHYGLQKENFLI